MDDRPDRELLGSLGRDAADLDPQDLDAILNGRRGGTKATLMNQKIVAGIGNELSDEILWRARVHPARRVSDLGARKRAGLARVTEEVLADSSRYGRIPREPGWLEEQRGSRDARCRAAIDRFAARGSRGGLRTGVPRCQRA